MTTYQTANIQQDLKAELSQFFENTNYKIIIIETTYDERSQSYTRRKQNIGKELGVEVTIINLTDKNEQSIIETISNLNNDITVQGIMVQLPLNNNLSKSLILDAIDPSKDIDVLTSTNHGKVTNNSQLILPATVAAILNILKSYATNLTALDIAIINNSSLIGLPLSNYLSNHNATVAIYNKDTKDLMQKLYNHDIIITATGVASLIDADKVKANLIIDAGISIVDGKVKGDVTNAENSLALVTPVPGGVGPLTVLNLFNNLKILAS
jgi:methylenetetrahydrofolate dehydrogenase (NADP+) / methenyltetrahydrofolate cyclohydrolase